MLTIAAIIMILTGLAHSYLGERFILIRLFKRDNLPKLLGTEDFTKNTLRFAWHITSITWFGIAAVLLSEGGYTSFFLNMVVIVSLLSGLMAFIFTKGKHLSWIAFLAIGILLLSAQ